MNQPVKFRTLRLPEAELFESMVIALYDEDPCGQPISRAKIRRTVEEFREHPDKGCITLFWMDKEAVGYAITVYLWSNEFGGDIAVLDELYVRPSWRGRGIAGRFLSRIGDAGSSDLKGILLEVTPDNDRAMAWYRREGFAAPSNRHLFKPLG